MSMIPKVIIISLFMINSLCTTDICQNKSDGFHTDYTSLNCRSFYLCRNERLNETLHCSNSSQSIFSSYRQRCVAKNVLYDECYLTNITENTANCAWFSVQLSSKANVTFHYSCFYPFLFDRRTKECEHYSQVACNQRFEPKDACDYHYSQMHNSINERPCWLTPSCRGKANGLHGNRLEDCSSYYECKDERFIHSTRCSRRMRFSDQNKTCSSTIFNCENTTVF